MFLEKMHNDTQTSLADEIVCFNFHRETFVSSGWLRQKANNINFLNLISMEKRERKRETSNELCLNQIPYMDFHKFQAFNHFERIPIALIAAGTNVRKQNTS